MERLAIGALIACFFLAACSPNPLSEEECRILVEKEFDLGSAFMPPEDRDAFREWAERDADEKVSACVSTQKSSRKYYECMANADDTRAMRECADAELARRR